tara:strand:- start:350 stop:592 length:243 start_codon:yes stop_codon:yes gene_type:complete
MQNEKINTYPIENFFKQVKSADASRAIELRIPINEAKQLSFALGQVLARYTANLEALINHTSTSAQSEIININVDGGKEW